MCRASAGPKGFCCLKTSRAMSSLPHLARLARLRTLVNRPAELAEAAAVGAARAPEVGRTAPKRLAAERRQSAEGHVRARGGRARREFSCLTSRPAASTSPPNSTSMRCCAKLPRRRRRRRPFLVRPEGLLGLAHARHDPAGRAPLCRDRSFRGAHAAARLAAPLPMAARRDERIVCSEHPSRLRHADRLRDRRRLFLDQPSRHLPDRRETSSTFPSR